MVHLNTTLHPYGHICMYNGSKWISDFVQNTIKTFSNDDPETYFFRYYGPKEINNSNKCKCYKAFLEDIFSVDDNCGNLILNFLEKEICPLIPGIDATEEEIDECEMKYFCGTESSGNNSKSINLSLFLILFSFILILKF